MRQEEIIVTCKEQLSCKQWQGPAPYEYFQYRAMQGGEGNACQVALYEIPPQKANYPYHYHTNSTEVFYIIRGSGMLKTPDGDKIIRAGDVIVCPPTEKAAHKIINDSETETLLYLDVDTKSGTDVAFYPDSGKVGVLVEGRRGKFYKENEDVPYYEGE